MTLTTLLTLLTAVIALVAFATLLTGLTTTTLLTLVGLLLLRLSRSYGLGRSFLALLIVAILLALAARLLTLEGLVIGALTERTTALTTDGLETEVEGLHRDLDLPDTDTERERQKDHTDAEDDATSDVPLQVVEEHSYKRDQQARRAEHLHPADEVETAVEVLDLLEGGRLTFGVILIALLEAAHRGGIGEEAIGISQEDERDRREKERWCGEIELSSHRI